MPAPILSSDLLLAQNVSSDLLLAQNVQPKATTPGISVQPEPTGPASASGQQPPSPLSGFIMPLMMLVIFVPFFFLMNRKQKKEQQARSALKKGDKVMTNSGLIGELVETDDRVARLKIAPGVTVQIVANTMSPFTETEKAPSKDLKEAAEKK